MIPHFALQVLRHIHRQFVQRNDEGRNWKLFPLKDYANACISGLIEGPSPCMVARLGANELACVVNYIGIKAPRTNARILSFVRSQSAPWWWDQGILRQMRDIAGFFPLKLELVERFCELMLADIPQVDLLGSWLKEEAQFNNDLRSAKKVMLEDLEPFFAPRPWTWSLAGKRVVVVHPFAETIQRQYARRELLFDNNLLPAFHLRTVQAVQGVGGAKHGFTDWFEALEWMKHEIAKEDYDVCILGCGAYGFPLAAYVKRQGKKAIHLGGVTQLLFGIKGRRWENYIVYPYQNLYNEYWVRPASSETPPSVKVVEGGCYW